MSSALPVQIDFLCLTSAEWGQNTVTRPLAKGELAWETAEESGEAIVYILKGDGYPPNHGKDSTDYKRLRISPAIGALASINSLIRGADLATSINKEYTRATGVEGVLSALNTAVKTNLVAAVNSEITARDNAITVHNARGSEENPDDGVHPYIQDLIKTETHRATGAEGDLDGRVIDLEDFCGTENFPQKTLPQVLGEYAPIANPAFIGLVTADEATFNKAVDLKGANTEVAQPRDNLDGEDNPAPYNNDDNPATVLDWKDLRELTMDTSGKHLIAFDAEFVGVELLLKADKGEGKEISFEYDNAWQKPPITQGQWKELYDMVMSLSGEKIALLGEEGLGGIGIRIDRAGGYPNELLEYDAVCCTPFGDVTWIV